MDSEQKTNFIISAVNNYNKMRKGYITLTIVGMAAAIAVFALNYFDVNSGLPEGLNL